MSALPGASRRAFVIGASSLGLALLPFAWGSTFSADEFTFMSDAARLGRGEVLYRDFFQFTAPLSVWLLALTFAFFGASLLVAHVLQSALVWAAAALAWAIARRLGAGPWTAWLPGVALALGLYPHYPGYNHHWVALPLVLTVLWAGLGALADPHPRRWAAAGALAGTVFTTIWLDGIVLLVAMAPFPLLVAWLAGDSLRAAWCRAGAFLAAFVVPSALAAAVLAAQGALGVALYDIFVWPLTFYRGGGGVNDLAFATDLPQLLLPVKALPGWYGRVVHYLLIYAFFGLAAMLAAGWGLGLLVRRLREGPGLAPAQAELGLVGLAALGFLALSTRGRADFVHVSMYLVPALIFLTALVPRWSARFSGPGHLAVRALPAAALGVFGLTGALMVAKAVAADPGTWRSLTPPDARLRETPIIAWLTEHARPGDTMVAMPAGGFYYFYGPPPATRNSYVLPPERGYTPEAQWREVGEEIARHRPRFVVIAPWPWGERDAVYARYVSLLPPGYVKRGEFRTPQWGGIWPAVVWEAAGEP